MNPVPNTSLTSYHNFTHANNPPDGYQLTESQTTTRTVTCGKSIFVTQTFTHKYDPNPSIGNPGLANRITPTGWNQNMRTSSSEPQLRSRIQSAAFNVLSL